MERIRQALDGPAGVLVLEAIILKAQAGDPQAARLLLSYSPGLPAMHVEQTTDDGRLWAVRFGAVLRVLDAHPEVKAEVLSLVDSGNGEGSLALVGGLS